MLLRGIRGLRRFKNSEDGSYSIEAVLWLPIFVVILALIIDISMVFNRKAEILRIVQDANRAYSIGRFATTTEVEDYIKAAIGTQSTNATISSAVTSGVVSTSIDIPLVDMLGMNIFPAFAPKIVNVSAQYYVESLS